METPRRQMSPIVLIVFFLSGFAALLYQVIWQRLLVIFSGADVYSVTIIVTAFMAGLGIGSYAGGQLADRIGPRACLRGFAIAEVCIGVFGLLSKTLFYDVLYLRVPGLAATPAVAAVVLLVSLLWPTFFMGLSLPLLARSQTWTLAAAGRVVGSLYGWNTIGAACGAFAATWLLLPSIGLERSLWLASALNLACAASVVVLARIQKHSDHSAGPDEGLTDASLPLHSGSHSQPLPFFGWVLAYGMSGFIALALEITWFRLLGVMLKSTAFTFGTLLAVYLCGIGLGAALGARRVERSPWPGRTFLALQCALVLYAGWSIVVLIASLEAGRPIKLVRYLGGYEPVDVQATVGLLRSVTSGGRDAAALTQLYDFIILYIGMPLLLIGPPTVLMGMSFPYLQKASHAALATLGRRIGTLLAANIAGSALGAMLAGWLLVPRLGTATTLKALVALGALFALPLMRGTSPRSPVARLVPAGILLFAAGAVVALPDGGTLWARLHSSPPGQILFAEDGAGLSLLKTETPDFSGNVGVFVNGLGQSWIPYGSVHTALGALPAFLHPSPARVLVIGLGSGDTAFGAAGRRSVKEVVSVEIIGVQRDTLERLARLQAYPGLRAFLSDGRVQHRTGDGRAYILQDDRPFDIIEADALRPGSAYSGNLYSREYFDLLRRHLAPGGLAVTWAPTPRIQRTFLSVFPHVVGFHDIFVGSNEPIAEDTAAIEARIAAERTYFEAAGIDIVDLLRRYLAVPVRFGPESARAVDDLNTDTFPKDEFALPF
jgi:spermidine synthase